MGEEGFSSDSSLLYHVVPPTAIVKSEALSDPIGPTDLRSQSSAAPQALPHVRSDCGGDLVLGRRQLAGNDDVTISFVSADASSDLYRNSVGDETVYIQVRRAAVRVRLRSDRRGGR